MGHLGENMQQNTCISTGEARKTIKGWGVSQKKKFFFKINYILHKLPSCEGGTVGRFSVVLQCEVYIKTRILLHKYINKNIFN